MSRIIKLGVVLGLVAGLTLMPAATADTVRVKATRNDTWDPAYKHITRGDRIVWRNPTGNFHNIKAMSNNWNYRKNLPPGERRAKRFRNNGTYDYKCTIHPGMRGVIHVQGR